MARDYLTSPDASEERETYVFECDQVFDTEGSLTLALSLQGEGTRRACARRAQV
jgi:hypothetical protein